MIRVVPGKKGRYFRYYPVKHERRFRRNHTLIRPGYEVGLSMNNWQTLTKVMELLSMNWYRPYMEQ